MVYHPLISIRPENYPVGAVLQVTCRVGSVSYRHVGITDGRGSVISNSKEKGKVVCQSLSDFAGDKHVTIDLAFQGGGASAYETARRRLGESYDIINNNCEHFISTVYGKAKESPQLQNVVVAVCIYAVLSLLFGKK